MVAYFTEYKIAVGNNNTAGFSFVEALTDGTYSYPPPSGIGTFENGALIVRGDGSVTFDGLPSCEWVFDKLFPSQITYLKTTYCSSGQSGLVTIRTISDSAYANYNARLIMPTQKELGLLELGGWYSRVVLKFTRMVAL